MKRWSITLLIVLVFTAVGGAVYLGAQGVDEPETAPLSVPQTVEVTRGTVQETVTAPGELAETKRTSLGFDLGGKIAELGLQPGDWVTIGQTLARLDTTPLVQALEEAQLQLSTAQAEHTRQLADMELVIRIAELKLQQGEEDHTRSLADAQAAVHSAKIRLERARLQYPNIVPTRVRLSQSVASEAYAADEYKKALDRPWEPQSVRDGLLRAWKAAQDALAISQAEHQAVLNSQAAKEWDLMLQNLEVEQTEAQLARLQDGSDAIAVLELQSARKALADLQTRGVDPLVRLAVEKAQADLAAATLVAPFDGVVLEVNVRPGEVVGAGMSLLVLTDLKAVEMAVSVIEEDMPLVEPGQPVELFFDAVPDLTLMGRVARVVPQRLSGARPLYLVYIAPTDGLPASLYPGMTVDASIIVAQREGVLRLPRSIVRAGLESRTKVQVWTGLRACLESRVL